MSQTPMNNTNNISKEETENIDFNEISSMIPKEEQTFYSNFLFHSLDAFRKCSHAAHKTLTSLKTTSVTKEKEEINLYNAVCLSNELKKKFNDNNNGLRCLNNVNLIEGNLQLPNVIKNKENLLDDLQYCFEQDEETIKYFNQFETIQESWNGPFSLKTFMPRYAQILTSKYLQKKNGDFILLNDNSLNLIETYRLDENNVNNKMVNNSDYNNNEIDYIDDYNKKFTNLSNTFAKQEFEEFRDCVKNQKENFSEILNESCFLSTLKYLYLIQAISCKEQIVKCLKKRNLFLGVNKMEDSALNDFVECANASPCTDAVNIYLVNEANEMLAANKNVK